MTHPLEEPRTFRALAKSHSKEIRLLKEIVWRWRRYSAFVPGVDGYWAAWPLAQWREWNGNPPRRTFDRWLKTLEDFDLIERERHRYSGTGICSFIRPTELTLKHLGDDADLTRLRMKTPSRKKTKKGAPLGAKVGAPHGATGGATDHTSFPSQSSCSSQPKSSHAPAHAKGKEGFGEKAKKKLILKKKKSEPEAPIAPPPQNTDLETLIAEEKAKAKEALAKKRLPMLLQKFPVLTGAHDKTVRHPYQMHGWKWATWSPDLIAKSYAKYVEFVDNWYSGKKGKGYKPMSYGDAEFTLDLDYPDIEADLATTKTPAKAKGIGSLLKKP